MMADNTLWVGGLAEEVTEDLLYELFLQAGPVDRVVRPKEKDGSMRKFAFVEFRHAESVPYAIQVMDGIKLFGQHLRLKGRTGSLHDVANLSSSTQMQHSSTPPSSLSQGSFNRSRSYHGAELLREDWNQGLGPPSSRSPLLTSPASFNENQNVQNGSLFAGSVNHLSQPFSHFNAYSLANMQPQMRLQQSMSLNAHAQRSVMNPSPGGYNNSAQNFNYGQQHYTQQWHRSNQQQFF